MRTAVTERPAKCRKSADVILVGKHHIRLLMARKIKGVHLRIQNIIGVR